MSKKKKNKQAKKDKEALPQAFSGATTFSVGLPAPAPLEKPASDAK